MSSVITWNSLPVHCCEMNRPLPTNMIPSAPLFALATATIDVWLGSMPGAVMQNTPLPERRTVTPPFALETRAERRVVDEAECARRTCRTGGAGSARGARGDLAGRPGRPAAGPS